METRLAPGFLIAMPQLADPNFERAVVLLLHHDEEGAFGLVVNRPSELPLADFCARQELPLGGADGSLFVHVGGPCELRRGFLLHEEPANAPAASLEVTPRVHLSAEVSGMRAVLASPRGRFRFFLGYAGWGPGQLERELAEGSWLTAAASADHVFAAEPAGIWRGALAGLGVDPARLQQSTGRH